MNAVMNNQFTLDELIKKDKQSKQKKGQKKPAAKVQTGKGMVPGKRFKPVNKQNPKGAQVIKPRIKGRGAGAIFKKKLVQNPENQRLAARRQQQTLATRGRGRAGLIQKTRGNQPVAQRRLIAQQRRGGANNQQMVNKKAPQQIQFQNVQNQQLQQQPQSAQLKLQQSRLKVRNVDEKTVTEQDIQRLFSKQGNVIKAKFDKNQFGQYLGSATVIYDRLASAQAAIKAYNGAQLDDRVMTVEFDVPPKLKKQINLSAGPLTNQSIMQIPKVKKTANAITKQGKTASVRLAKQKQGPRRGPSAGKTLNVRGRKTDRK